MYTFINLVKVIAVWWLILWAKIKAKNNNVVSF